MNKKQLIAFAQTIKDNRSHFSAAAIACLAHFCTNQNPAFKRDRWLGFINGTCGPNGGKSN